MNFLRRSRGSDDGSKQKDQSAYEKRRQQVRRAQRNHRERKQNYIAALEQEVVNLRRQNQQNIQELEDEVSMLHGFIIHHGLVPPGRRARVINAPDKDVDVYYPSSYTVTKPSGLEHPLQLQLPAGIGKDLSAAMAAQGLDPPRRKTASPSSGSGRGQGSLSPPSASVTVTTEHPLLSAGLAPSAIDKTHGIEFVLTLEHPCMQHPDLTRDEFGTHSHMATHNLLGFAPRDITGPASWEVPGADIEHLLNLSTSFQLQGEITPVQAWFKLKQHPRFNAISEAQLVQLRGLLVSDVKCYGFGSVMDEKIWAIALDEVFGQAG